MPDSLDQLKQFVEESTKRFLKELPAEERVEGLSPDELLAALSAEMRAALAQRLKDYDSPAHPATREPGHGNGEQ